MDKKYDELNDYEKIKFLGYDVESRHAQYRHLNYYLTKDGNRVLSEGKPIVKYFSDTNGKNKNPAEVRPDSAGLYALRDLREITEKLTPPPQPDKPKSRIKNRP